MSVVKLEGLTYQNIKVSPFDLTHLQELKITRKLNDHAYMSFTGIVPEEEKDRYILMCDEDTRVEISQLEEEGGSVPLFCGLIRHIAVKAVHRVYYLEVEAVSPTYELDVKKRSRSFQDTSLSYQALLNKVASSYQGIDILDEATSGAAIGRFTMQYLETDWEFLKRLASRLRTALIPAVQFQRPKFYFGLPDGNGGSELKSSHYRVLKRLEPYRYTSQNTQAEVTENDYIYYEVESVQVLNLGDSVKFKGHNLYVYEAVTTMTAGIVKHLYTLSSRAGLRQNILYNEQIIGASLQGEVISLQGDRVKVRLHIDEEQSKSGAYAFPYASVYTAEGNSGWYCMPEVGDQIRVYFPSFKEEEGIASSSVRQNSDEGESNKVSNPDHKVFRTPTGKELKMTPEELVITGKDGEIYIRLSEAGGIEIASSLPIRLIAKEDIVMNADQKIVLSAKEQISLVCKDSSITMDGATNLLGTELKTN
ncbi:contractile injection system protein, VgrG/Pvc8 family [Paenibacillus pinihumi]|uniref:contractile injection system protein, VgrG/Pvc8 family n=1 Tax=Paenibacillus pinihumi TaxID=669462 RepID=UPI0004138DE5|nr:contractile injection system protein, VgrG/Pvc8 family [Paenibacillus pinihumi]